LLSKKINSLTYLLLSRFARLVFQISIHHGFEPEVCNKDKDSGIRIKIIVIEFFSYFVKPL
jgi:hypothetical protein